MDHARRTLIERRRQFTWPGYESYADAGLEGDYVSPYQLSCGNPSGPVLLTYNFLDAPTARREVARLRQSGYLPEMPFNRVLDRALAMAGLERADLYVTHAFHLLARSRSETLPARAVEASFDAVARHEIAGRPVIALGQVAAIQCRRHGIAHLPLPHPSARGQSFETRASVLADALLSTTSRCASAT
ncbi:hypothetical protein SAMN02983003_1005 [Devosia enhydra]|uniref:Uracil DNA glycosylase superfamily protein n=1 Tax=Devosia enhydra TaxID=665118 RepID=A0A1K2HV43_9HYPH|nr:hypothetical protein [Devosia enhydra]SFZ82315.1 hypothetical protein SAMN02983003_1005 [Devosia enhydra]